MLVRVFEIPPPTGKFHFAGGEPQTFVEVDWFRDDAGMIHTEDEVSRIESFIRRKQYFDPGKAYLVLHPAKSFTIGYSAP